MKKKFRIIICFLLAILSLAAQEKKFWKRTGFNIQYAGSTGFLSSGFLKRIKSEKIEFGLMYGYTPKKFGGPLHSVTGKILYNPRQIKFKKTAIEPFQTGVFLTQHFGSNVDVLWPRSQYPSGYYWWSRSLRKHVFVSSGVTFNTGFKDFNRLSLYFEANTNDLYLFSYFHKQNYRSLTLYDIIFFGLGVKLHR